MMDASSQPFQLDELPPIPAVVKRLQGLGVQADEARAVYPRFVWELRRGASAQDALANARFARLAVSSTEPLSELRRRINRGVITLGDGGHFTLPEDPRVSLLNLSGGPLDIPALELITAREQLCADRDLLAVFDDHEPSAQTTVAQVTWNVSTLGELDGEQNWRALTDALNVSELPELIVAHTNHRRLHAPAGQLPSELAVRAQRARALAKTFLTDYTYGTSGEQMMRLEDSEADWALDRFDHHYARYTEHPRLVLPCLNLNRLQPALDWHAQDSASIRALLGAVTGDDPLLSGVLRGYDPMQLGALAFTGDADNVGDDLLSAMLPQNGCFAVLRPQTLDQTIFLAGVPHPTRSLPVPHQAYGFYSTLAIGSDVRDLLRARAYLHLAPLTTDSIDEYFSAVAQTLTLDEDVHAPTQSLLAAVSMCRNSQDGSEQENIETAFRASVLSAAFARLGKHRWSEGIGGVHLGPLRLEDIEQIVVPVNSSEDFIAFHQTGQLPEYLQPLAEHYGSHGIKLRPRAPVFDGPVVVVA